VESDTTRTSRRWFVTGCSAGLGRRICEAVIERGDQLVATARQVEHIKDLEEAGRGRAVILPLDVTDHRSVLDAVSAGIEAFDGIDILVNNAATGTTAALEESSDEDVQLIIGTNLLGTIDVTRAFLPHFRQKRAGHIVTISSGAAVATPPTISLYMAAKYGEEAIFAVLAKEVAQLGIKVTLVEPGSFKSDWRFRTMSRPARRIDDYKPVTDPVIAVLDQPYSETSSDPRDFARWILDMTDSDSPPLRLPMGPDSWAVIGQGLHERLSEFEQLEREWKPRQTLDA
jgi:NAD(P)-dependent dehydrogenase (short-subunit alcohol dehydrogenase family)